MKRCHEPSLSLFTVSLYRFTRPRIWALRSHKEICRHWVKFICNSWHSFNNEFCVKNLATRWAFKHFSMYFCVSFILVFTTRCRGPRIWALLSECETLVIIRLRYHRMVSLIKYFQSFKFSWLYKVVLCPLYFCITHALTKNEMYF